MPSIVSRIWSRVPKDLMSCLPENSLTYLSSIKGIARITSPRFPDAVHHEPGTGLAYAQIPVKFHAGNRFEGCNAEINADCPLSHGNVGSGHRCSGPDTEIGSAGLAPVRHWFGIGNFPGFITAALGTCSFPVRPDTIFKPFNSGFLGWKHIHHLNDGNSFSVGFSCCFLNFQSPLSVMLHL